MLNYIRVLLGILTSILLATCATDNTPQPNPAPEIKNPIAVKINWEIGSLSKGYPGSFVPVMDQNGAIFTADSSGSIYKIDASDGTIIFHFNVKHRLSSGTAISSDSIFVTTLDDYILCISKANQSIKWKVKLPTLSIEAPQAINDTVIVRTNDASLLAYNVQTGNLLWVYQRPIPTLTLRATSSFQLSPAGDVLVYGQPGGRLSIINLLNGNAIWDAFIAIPGGATDLDKLTDIDMRPVLNDDRTICVGSYNGKLVCLDALTSNIIWSNKFSTSTQIILDSNALYAISQDGVVYAFDRKNGDLVWKNDALQYRTLGPEVFLSDYIVTVDNEGYINLFNKIDGRIVSRVSSDLLGGTSYPVSDGYKIIMQSASGNIAGITVAN